MQLEYKGFSIEDSGDEVFSYSIWHTVTGSGGGNFKSIRDAKNEINIIHQSEEDYANFAGCEPSELEYVRARKRFRYKR